MRKRNKRNSRTAPRTRLHPDLPAVPSEQQVLEHGRRKHVRNRLRSNLRIAFFPFSAALADSHGVRLQRPAGGEGGEGVSGLAEAGDGVEPSEELGREGRRGSGVDTCRR